MMELEYRLFADNGFANTLVKVGQINGFDAKFAIKFLEIIKTVDGEYNRFNSFYEKLHADIGSETTPILNEKGDVQRDRHGKPLKRFIIADDKIEEFDKRYEELLCKKFTVKQDPIEIDELKVMKPSSLDIENLKPILTGLNKFKGE